MSRTTAPLLSFGASGAIAKTQVYASWKGRSYARRYVIPANPQTAEQTLTRSTFSFLTNLWKYMPAAATAAWDLYADNSRITNRNAFLKLNLSNLRAAANLNSIVLSPSAGSGLAASAVVLTPGNDQVTVDVTAPTLPTGWSIDKAVAVAVRDQDPNTGALFVVSAGEDATSAYQIILTGLASAVTYQVQAFFVFTKPDGSKAYGVSIGGQALTT